MKRIVMFGGGSGSRDITMALCRARFDVTRVVPAWDSGGSSKALRASLGILAMGDIRQALMTMAHGEGRGSGVVRFFNARLSEAASPADLRAEFHFYASGAHPLLGSMAPEMRNAVLDYLRVFESKIDPDFDFRRGSIGNFVLTGAYVVHGHDINAAIDVFRTLCAIDGQVRPSTADDAVELIAELRDGSRVHGQDRVTALGAGPAQIGIASVQLTAAGADESLRPAANPAVIAAIGAADLLLFGPGSFYTSTLAHLGVAGIAEAIRATRPAVPKVFISNILECAETIGRTVAEQLHALAAAGGTGVVSHVLVNRGWVPFERVVKGFRYLHEGTLEPISGWLPQVIADDFEDPWDRGRHDALKVVATLGRIA
jgi:uncharacterized cofD-like protein